MEKKFEILAVKKDGVDYHWFNLITKEGAKYTVHGVHWIVDESVEGATVIRPTFNKEYPTTIDSCEIIGNSKQIANLMVSLGWSTPEHPTDTIYALTFSDAVRSLQSCIYQMEELLKEKTHEEEEIA